MRKINLVFKTLGLSTIILSSCISPTIAQTASEDLEQLQPSSDFLERPSTPEEVEIDITQPITLEEAIQLAVRNNKDLQAAKLNLERAEKQLQEARAALFPTLNLGVDFTNTDSSSSERNDELRFQRAREQNPNATEEQLEDIVNAGQLEGSDDVTQLTGDLTLNYNLYTGGERGAEIRIAKQLVEENSLQVEEVTEQVLFETSRDYYDLQNSDAQVEIEQAAVDDANQTLKDAQLLERAGLGTRFDVLRAEVELANAEQRLTTAMANQKTARRQLVTTLSVGQEVNLKTADKIETAGVWDKSLEESIILGYQNRVELERLLARRERNKAEKQSALSSIRPQISLFARYEVLEQLDDDVDIADGYSVGAQLQWALFDGGRALARARQFDKAIESDEVSFANQRNDVRLQVEQAFFDLQANKNNITTAQKAVELAEESLRLARLRFQAGVGTQTDVIEAQSDLTTARGNELRAIIDYNQSLNQLQRAVNGLVDLRLSTVDEQTVNSEQ
ncbi:MAG: TolC family protein [Xenococcaceae cyanobacterium MO_188.B19]|nr:TolC family protein [Xenococcaceae cyanobacterium MO_188.B19]